MVGNPSGLWSLAHARNAEKGPRPPSPDGGLTLILFGADGVELYREPLSVITFSEGGVAGWAARTPMPPRPAREAVILNSQGVVMLREELPALDQAPVRPCMVAIERARTVQANAKRIVNKQPCDIRRSGIRACKSGGFARIPGAAFQARVVGFVAFPCTGKGCRRKDR